MNMIVVVIGGSSDLQQIFVNVNLCHILQLPTKKNICYFKLASSRTFYFYTVTPPLPWVLPLPSFAFIYLFIFILYCPLILQKLSANFIFYFSILDI